MDMKTVLDRIAARAKELGLSEKAVSEQVGSSDLIRNWRRALDRGQEIRMRHDSLQAVARALQVDMTWLIGEDISDPTTAGSSTISPVPAEPFELRESATPFILPTKMVEPNDPQPLLRALWGIAILTPATYLLQASLPAFGMTAGDVVVVDLARLPKPGELALVTIHDDVFAAAKTTLRRYLPPYLAEGNLVADTQPLRVDDAGVTVRCAVVGSIRGLPHTSPKV